MKKIVIEMHHYQITSFIAVFAVITIVTFLTGYFWGKKSALEEFAEQIKNESFSDKVYASLCALYEQPLENNTPAVEEPSDISQEQQARRQEVAQESEKEALFVAQLIGYGTEKQAFLYQKSLERRGIQADIITRTSITARGKKKVWYQVVTQPASYTETQQIAERLTREDCLAGVSLVENIN